MARVSAGVGARDVPRLWEAGHESGTLGDWLTTHGGFDLGGPVDTTNGVSSASTTHAHSGSWSTQLEITVASGAATDTAARLFRWATGPGVDLPLDAVYSCWFYLAQNYTPDVFLNIFQFKTRTGTSTSDPDWTLNVARDATSMHLYWYDHHRVGAYGTSGTGSFSPGAWHQIVVRYLFHATNGSVTAWLDGAQWYSESGVATAGASPFKPFQRQWSVNAYSDGVAPSPCTIWVDDAWIGLP